MDWPKVIKEVLDHLDIPQYQLAERIGVSKSYVTHLIKGYRKDPSFSIGLAIINLHPNKKEYLK